MVGMSLDVNFTIWNFPWYILRSNAWKIRITRK